MFALVAAILFALAAFGVKWDEVGIVELGLACVAVHLLIGLWPFGTINFPVNRNRS